MRETSTSEGGNYSPNFASRYLIYNESTRVFYMPQIWDILFYFLSEGILRIFRMPEKSNGFGFEPANSGSSGQYANH
jgi:hypothetical protein